MRRDPRVRAAPTQPLPAGWNGKQHACWRMAQAAKGEWMLFTDADVRFEPGCLKAALDQASLRSAGLVSTFPRQVMGSIGEALIIPMIFFILLSYLPFPRMRRTNDPAASAGCGQFLFVRKDAYAASGGHEGFKASMHDGIMLPRAVRRAGFHSDLFDGTALLECRMYRGFAATWRGFAKNAYEGLGSVGLLVFITIMHAAGHVFPFVLLGAWAMETLGVWDGPLAEAGAGFVPGWWALGAVATALGQRVMISVRMRHPLWIIPLHPVSVVLMTLVQWYSLVLHLTGRRSWKGRTAGAAVGNAAA